MIEGPNGCTCGYNGDCNCPFVPSATDWSRWTGPSEADLAQPGGDVLRAPVPGNRWPYGAPSLHERSCGLHTGGLFCDCAMSCVDDDRGDQEDELDVLRDREDRRYQPAIKTGECIGDECLAADPWHTPDECFTAEMAEDLYGPGGEG